MKYYERLWTRLYFLMWLLKRYQGVQSINLLILNILPTLTYHLHSRLHQTLHSGWAKKVEQSAEKSLDHILQLSVNTVALQQSRFMGYHSLLVLFSSVLFHRLVKHIVQICSRSYWMSMLVYIDRTNHLFYGYMINIHCLAIHSVSPFMYSIFQYSIIFVISDMWGEYFERIALD